MAKLYYQSDYANCKTWGCVVSSYVGDDSQNGKANQASHIARSGMSANTPVPASNDTNGWVKWMQGATRAEYGSAGVQMLSEADIRKGVAQFNNGTPSQAQSQTQTAPAAQPTTQQIRSDLITSANALDTPANRANGWQKLRQVTLQSALVGASYKVRDQQPISPAEQDALKPYLPGDTKFTNGVIPNKAEAEKAYSQLDRYISHEKDNWCAGTAATILEKVAPQVPHYVYADDFYKDYKQNNAYHPKGDGYTPQPMDAFWIAKANPQPETPLGEGYTRRDANGALQPGRSQVTGHVGFILSYNPATGMVHTREGNNNGQYGEFDRPLSSIMGFGDTAKYLQAKGATPAAANATAASAAAQAAPSGAFRAASVPGQKPVASPTSASLQKDAGLQISVCVGTAKCGDGIQFNSRNYINPLCQKDLGCTASASELAGVPDAKYPEQAFKDPLSSQAQQYYQQQVERAAQNASQGRVLIDNCNNVDYAVCKTILDKLQAWNQQHPAQPVKAWINNAHFETDTNTLPLWSHPVAGGATVEQDIENPQESSPAYLDKRRQEAGVPGLPILFAGSEQYAAEVQRQIQQGGYPGMGTSGSKVGDGPNGFKTTDTTSAISGQAGPNTPVGAMQRFAQTAPAFVFGRSGADGKPELLDPKTAAQAQAKGEKLDVYENVKPLPFRAQQYTKVGDQYYQRAGTVDEYAARQTAGAQAALQNGAYAQQLGSKMDKPVMIEGQGSTRPVYGLNADGSKGDPLGTLKTMSKEQVQLLNAAQKLGVELKECDAGYCTKDGKLAELRAENGGKPGDAPRTVGGVSGQNRRVWNPNVQARTPTTEERVGALKAAGVKVVDNRGAGAYPARSGAIVGEFVHGDLASGEKLVSYCAQTRKCYNDIVMEDGTVVMMGGTDKAPFHAFGAADYTNGIVVAGADGGRSATPAQLETVRKILSVDMDQFGWWVTTHGESAANSIGGRNINEAGPNVRAMIFDGGIPAGDQQLGLYLSDPANPNDRGTRFGDVFNASSLPPARESATFTSTDGKTIVGLDPVGDVGKATASLTTDSDGNLGVNYNYEAPKPPETPDTRSPIEKIRDAAADAQTKMRDMWKNMFGGGQQPGGQQGGGGAQPANNAVPANNSRPAGGAAQPSNSGTPAPAPARTGQQPATTANGASGSQTPVVSVSGGNTATGISGERFTCSPGTVVNGSTATPLTIAWTCPAGTTSIGTGFSTLGTNSGSVQLVVSTTSASVNYQLTCQGAQASQTLSCAVQVRHPRVTLVAKPASVESGAPVQLQWSAFDVTSCSLYAPPTVLLVSGGTQGTANTLPLSRSSVFSALCNVGSATTTASVTVLVKGDTATPLQTVLPR
jgi:ribosomal protein L28